MSVLFSPSEGEKIKMRGVLRLHTFAGSAKSFGVRPSSAAGTSAGSGAQDCPLTQVAFPHCCDRGPVALRKSSGSHLCSSVSICG